MKKIWQWLTGNVIKEVGDVIDNNEKNLAMVNR
jgi:chemotaxis regulatin CheY-phosphate phosphatase CheZ